MTFFFHSFLEVGFHFEASVSLILTFFFLMSLQVSADVKEKISAATEEVHSISIRSSCSQRWPTLDAIVTIHIFCHCQI